MIGEALAQFKKEGFYIARNLLKNDEIIAVRNDIHKSFNDQLAHLGFLENGKDLFNSMLLLYSKDIDRYKRLIGALWRKLEVYNLMHHNNIVGLLREQFGWQDIFMPGGQVAVIMAEELKIPNGYFGFVPHQDFPSVQGSLDGVVVWLPLVDVGRDNYPLEIIPRSHYEGVLPAKENNSSTWETDTSQYTEDDYLPVEVNVGDVVFMTLFTIHRSSQRGTAGQVRIALSTRFDNANEATFIDRCYPTAYIRTVQREQYFKGFPTPGQVAKIFPK